MSSSLSLDQHKDLVRHYLETAWNVSKTNDTTDAPTQAATNDNCENKQSYAMTPNSSTYAYSGSEPFSTSLEQIREALHATFPDVSLIVTDLVAEGKKVVARWTMRGTDLGGYDGHLPTRRPVCLTGITIVRIEDHIIVEEWNEVDMAGMLRQLGFIHTPRPPKITMRRPRPIDRSSW